MLWILCSMFEEQRSLNLSAEKFNDLRPHFIVNVDETCVMASEGTVKVIGDEDREKHTKNICDNKDSITIVRVGNAGGTNGPLIFLAKGQRMDVKALENLEDLGAPKGSKIIMTPNAYMTDDAWAELALPLAKGIREMEVSFKLLHCKKNYFIYLKLNHNTYHSFFFYVRLSETTQIGGYLLWAAGGVILHASNGRVGIR